LIQIGEGLNNVSNKFSTAEDPYLNPIGNRINRRMHQTDR